MGLQMDFLSFSFSSISSTPLNFWGKDGLCGQWGWVGSSGSQQAANNTKQLLLLVPALSYMHFDKLGQIDYRLQQIPV